MSASFVLLLAAVAKCTFGANILFITLLPSPSHHVWNEVLAGRLLENGHTITLIAHQEGTIRSKNYTALKIDGYEKIYKQLNVNDLIYSTNSPIEDIFLLWSSTIVFAELGLNSDVLKTILDYPKDAFDLIIFDITWGQYYYPLIDYFGNPPVIGVSPFALPPYVLDAMGSEIHSYFPIVYLPYTDRMSFLQRIKNMALYMMEYYIKWKQMSRIFQLAQDRFGKDIVQFDRVERQFQLLLANYDPTLDFPVPLPPNIIPVGGLHTTRSTPLPDDLASILNNSKNEIIYFSFGTNVEPSWLSPDKKNIFLRAFSRLKQVVLWKYDGDDLKNVPKNVLIRKWYPQNNILAHRNVRIYITHGGIFGTTEAMYHAVPVIVIPLFMDQRNIAEKMIVRKLGKKLLMSELTEDGLYETIREVLDNPTYKENMKKISRLFRSQKETPLERAVYWVEYTLRHKNLSHLWTTSRDMTIYERQNLDIFGFVFLCLFVLILSVFLTLKWFVVSYVLRGKEKIKTN